MGSLDLPPPLLPREVDLRSLPYMPIDIVRLFNSEFHANADDAEWRAGLTLWLKSYHQVPAASLPDDEISLTRLAELGRDVKAWRKLRDVALRGWVKCSDGRLYHPVVAEKAVQAWNSKLVHLWRRECDRLRKENKARSTAGEAPLSLPPKPRDVCWNSVYRRCEIQENSIGFPSENMEVSDGNLHENALNGKGKGNVSLKSPSQTSTGLRELGEPQSRGGVPATPDGLDPGWDDDHPFSDEVAA